MRIGVSTIERSCSPNSRRSIGSNSGERAAFPADALSSSLYPFHPSTSLSFSASGVRSRSFNRHAARCAMFAQWVSIAFSRMHKEARREALVTLGSAPLHVREFRSVVLRPTR